MTEPWPNLLNRITFFGSCRIIENRLRFAGENGQKSIAVSVEAFESKVDRREDALMASRDEQVMKSREDIFIK